MTDVERQILEAQIAAIDRRRAEIEYQLSAMPHAPHCCDECEREELEIEFRDLWASRVDIFGQLKPKALPRLA